MYKRQVQEILSAWEPPSRWGDREPVSYTHLSLLDEVREINIGNELAVTLCIGVGSDAANYAQSAEWARSAIELALGRGGDQAVVKEREKIYYYGGKTKPVSYTHLVTDFIIGCHGTGNNTGQQFSFVHTSIIGPDISVGSI